MTTAAAKATAAADALLAWLRDQPAPVLQRRESAAPVPAPPEAGAADAPPGAAAAGLPAEPAGEDASVDHTSVAPASPVPAPATEAARPMPRTAMPFGAGDDRGAPLSLAHTDWLYHHLSITGPAAALAAFQAAAACAGIIPWHLDLDRIAEDCFHRLVAPPPPDQRSLSLGGARIVAGQLRDAVAQRHELAVSRVGHSQACPFDLHALVPVPGEILRYGPDDPASRAWLWEHWGTSRELRHVTVEIAVAGQERRRQPGAGGGVFQVGFWSADWSPWRALARIAASFPALHFALCPSYDTP
jgi:hypothetical protein